MCAYIQKSRSIKNPQNRMKQVSKSHCGFTKTNEMID